MSDTANAEHLAGKAAAPAFWVQVLGRTGIAAMGIVYLAVGLLALQVAFGTGGSLADSREALASIGRAPFGQLLLSVVAAGLVAFALFRIVAAWLDIDDHGHDAKGIVGRIGFAFSGLAYGSLGASILGLRFLGWGSSQGGQQQSGGEGSSSELTAQIMAQPLGRWVVAGIGIAIIAYAGYTGYKAVTRKFLEVLKTQSMTQGTLRRVSVVGTAGILARALVLAITGIFFIQAAVQFDASETGGLPRALAALAVQPFGPWLLAGTSAGLVLFALFIFYMARYRQLGDGDS